MERRLSPYGPDLTQTRRSHGKISFERNPTHRGFLGSGLPFSRKMAVEFPRYRSKAINSVTVMGHWLFKDCDSMEREGTRLRCLVVGFF